MYIHEAVKVFESHPNAAISRKRFLAQGLISSRIMLSHDAKHFVELFYVDGKEIANLWVPTVEELAADDWYVLMPVIQKGKRVRWNCKGLLSPDH